MRTLSPITIVVPNPSLIKGGSTLEITRTINGTSGDDSLVGSASGDLINGLNGSDTLVGGGGIDTLTGGNGSDYYMLTNPDDVNDVINETGNGLDDWDTIVVSFDYTVNAATTGIESYQAAAGTASLNLTGSTGNDALSGNDGNNVLKGGAGNDGLIGGKGDDVYYVDSALDVVLEWDNGGNDTLIVEKAFSGQFSLNHLRAIENLTLLDSAGAGKLISGNFWNNILTGNAFANTISGGAGADTLIGGGGNDYFNADSADKVVETENGGIDTISVGFSHNLNGTNIENLHAAIGSSGPLTLIGDDTANEIKGGAGADILDGSGGNDFLYGSGNDKVFGGEGNDTFDAAKGSDTLSGGAGNDKFVIRGSSSAIIDEVAGGGTDYVEAQVNYTLAKNAHIEKIVAAGALFVGGSDIGNVMNGDAFGNRLEGNGGNDTITALGGDDVLVGGTGADILLGGTGKDSFLYNVAPIASNYDVINDFSVADDTIQLSKAAFTALGATGVLNANDFIVGTAAADSSDRIIYNDVTGAVSYDQDGIGGAAAVMIFKIAAHPAMTHADFLVI